MEDMNKIPGGNQPILGNGWFNQKSIQITHSITSVNEKRKITQKEFQKLLEKREI